MLFGLDLVETWGRNVSVNGAAVPEGKPRLLKGESPRRGVLALAHSGEELELPRDVAGSVHISGWPLVQRCPPDSLVPGISVWWLGDFLLVESSLGVRVKFDGRSTVYVTVGAELRGATRGLCGVYNEDRAGNQHKASSVPILVQS